MTADSPPPQVRARSSSSLRSRVLTVNEAALKLGAGLVEAADLCKQVAAYARQEVVALKRRLRGQFIDELESRDEPRRLDPPDRVDRTMGIGSHHGD